MIHNSLDSRWFIYPSKAWPQGATDIGDCRCNATDWQGRFCAVQKVIGPLGSNPDYYREVDRKRICDTMGRMTSRFSEMFGEKRIWSFKYAETIMFLPLLQRVWGDQFRFVLNVRNPACQQRFGYFEWLETLECFHLRKDDIWDTLVAVDSQFDSKNPLRNDLFHSMAFHDLLKPTWVWLHQTMSEQFVLVRHEDLLTEEGVERFAYNVEHLLNIQRVGDAKVIADQMASASRACQPKPIFQSKRREVEKFMNFFNYTATYNDMQTLLK